MKLNRTLTALEDTSFVGQCCDLCHPELLERTLPGRATKRKAGRVKRDMKNIAPDVVDALHDWRLATWTEDLEYCGFSDVAILSDERIDSLAAVPEFASEKALKSDMEDWLWWSTYGRSLWVALSNVYDARAAQERATGPAPRQERAQSSRTLPVTAPTLTAAAAAPRPPSAPLPPAAVVQPVPATPALSTAAKRGPPRSTSSGSAAKRQRVTEPNSIVQPPAGSAASPSQAATVTVQQPVQWFPAPLSPGQPVPRTLRAMRNLPVPQGVFRRTRDPYPPILLPTRISRSVFTDERIRVYPILSQR
ncbi:hypothetical protein EXIGLDRAFT_776132 [Exidia glandulosa HHB12029]|uniref:Uncharacterized protein n=1 Tax=Exidia glandulosa HHB12029 TaxID=1314781 RepID=A0A165DL73_EXIGL|nr:hypothetical protein EXIGLDRAFT_776132 [Exidia glandulosa HHB12029]